MIWLWMLAAALAAERSLTLEEAWELAASAPQAEVARSLEASGRAARLTGRAYTNPELSYTGMGRTSGTADAINRQQHQLEVGLALPLTGARSARLRLGKTAEQLGFAEADQARAELAEEVALDWLELRAAQERLSALEDATRGIDRLLDIVRARVENGAARPYDADRIALVRTSLLRQVALEEQIRKAASARLAATLGMEGELSAEGALAERIAPERSTEGEPAWLKQVRLLAEQAEAELRVARRSRLADPTLRIGGYWTTERDLGPLLPPAPTPPSGDSFSAVAGLDWELPVFDRGRGPVAEAKAEQAARRAELRLALRRYEAELTALREALDALRSALETDAAAEAARIQQAAEVAWLEGESEIFELVDAVSTRVDTTLEQVDLWLALRSAEIGLRAVQGDLDSVIR